MARLLLLSSELPPFRGGIATYAHELAAAAAAAGHDVTVAGPDYGADQSEHDRALPYRVRRFAGGAATMRGMPGRIALARRLLRDGPFDVVHAADWPFFIPVRLASRPAGTRVVLTLHGTEILYMSAPRRRRVIDWLRFWRPGWAQWIANSRFTRDLALSRFPLDPATIRAVPLGVARDWIADRPDRTAARARLDVGDRLVVVSLGRVVPRKGHLVLAEALGQLPPALAARIDWWIIGPIPDAAHADLLRQRLAALPCNGALLGPLPAGEVKERLAAADLFCLPGYAAEDGTVEGFGLVFLEAAAYGVPALATVSGGIPDAVIDGETGVLVPERDPAALAGALAALLEDDARRARMAEAAAAFARAMSWERVMADTYHFGTAPA